jgi:hypothetical protein
LTRDSFYRERTASSSNQDFAGVLHQDFREGNVDRIRRVFFVAAFLAFVIGALLPSGAQAQGQGAASLNGTVTDVSGATVPGASVKLQNTQTGTTVTTETASDGGYRFVDVPPGPGYALTVTKDGFQTLVLNGIYLPTAIATTKDAQITVGQVSQTVEVTADTGSVSLNTTDATIGTNMDMNAVANLPDEFRDDPSALLRLQVGVTSAQTTSGNAITSNIDPNHTRDGAVAGARADQNNIVVDGIDATDMRIGQPFATVAAIPVDALQEFSTQVAEPPPAFGGHSGATTLITTKSGTNEFHGSAYEYNRTAATEANTYFNKQNDVPRLALVRNQFGANVGGPVIKDKLFFFFEYDGRRDASAESITQIVPMPHTKTGQIAYINNSGDSQATSGSADANPCKGARLTSADTPTSCISFASAAQVKGFDPCTANPGACTGPGFVSGGPAPVILGLFNNRYPNPNDYAAGDGVNTAGLLFNAPDPYIENGYLAHIDFNLSTNNKMFGRFNVRNVKTVNNNVGVLPIQFPSDSLTALETQRDRAWVFGDTWTLSPNLINQFTYGESRSNLAFPVNAPQAGSLYELTFFGASEGNTFATPYDRQTSQADVVPDPTFRDDVTWTKGKHTVTFGAEFNPAKVRSSLTNDFAFIQEGLGGAITTLNSSFRPNNVSVDPGTSAATKWDNFFLGDLGLIWNYQVAINYNGQGTALPAGSGATRDWRMNSLAGYVQDVWRIRPDLTATFGVRYQYQDTPYEVHATEAQFFNTNVNQIVAARIANGLAGIATDTSTPLLTYQKAGKANGARPLYNADKKDFSPRLALSWNPSFTDGLLGKAFGDRKTVVRAGGALLYDESVIYAITNYEDQSNYLFGNTVADQPNTGNTNLTNVLETDPRMNSVSALPIPITAPAFQNPLTPAAIFNDGIDPNLHTPYAITASLGVQRALPGGFQFEGDYYGRFGRRLMLLADTSQTIDFTDPASKQTLSQAFSVLEQDSRANNGQGLATVPNQPFFENQISSALGQSCQSKLGESCTTAVYSSQFTTLQNGGTGEIVASLPFNPNVGLTPQFFVDALMANKGFSDYNALFATLRKRLSNNLQFDFNYTYSHSIDNGSTVSNENGNFESGSTSVMCDVTNNRACRGNSEFDLAHQISADFVYDLPFGRGQMFGRDANMLLNEAIGGWQVSGIETWHSGFAFTANNTSAAAYDTVSLAADTGMLFTGTKSQINENIHLDSLGNVQIFSNPANAAAAFSPVTGLQSGDRDTLRGPHYSNLDLALSKNFPIYGEKYNLKFVAQAFNVFNHANFGLPDTGTTDSNFGVITGLVGEEPSRVMQFALRFTF